MTGDGETVADVLRGIKSPDVNGLLRVAKGTIDDPSSLDYEDYVRPLKLSGGRICLRADHSERDDHYWFTCRSDTLRAYTRTDDITEGITAMYMVLRCMEEEHVELTPVLREDTPFTEEEV